MRVVIQVLTITSTHTTRQSLRWIPPKRIESSSSSLETNIMIPETLLSWILISFSFTGYWASFDILHVYQWNERKKYCKECTNNMLSHCASLYYLKAILILGSIDAHYHKPYTIFQDTLLICDSCFYIYNTFLWTLFWCYYYYSDYHHHHCHLIFCVKNHLYWLNHWQWSL